MMSYLYFKFAYKKTRKMSRPQKISTEIIGSKMNVGTFCLQPNNFILYALGIGFSRDPLNTNDLKYTYELDKRFSTFPTIASCLGQAKHLDGIRDHKHIPVFDWYQVLHAQQRLHMVHRSLKVGAKYEVESQVIDIHDRGQGKGVFLIDRMSGYLINERGQRQLAYYIDKNHFVRSLGGSGVKSTGKIKPIASAPKRPCDKEWTEATFPNQAILYRLNSDPNPLHIDPENAKLAGFPKPIIHGLATSGTVSRSIVQTLLNNDAELMESFECRFTGHVFPGESFKIKTWKQGNKLFYEAWVVERGTKAVMGVIGLREEAKL